LEIFKKPRKPKDILKYINKKEIETTKKAILNLYENFFLIENDKIEEIKIQKLRNKLKKPKFNILYLLVTNRCNFKCKYCFIEGNYPKNYKFKDMEWKTAKKAIDLFFYINKKKKNKEGQIIFYGGEPLLNYKLIKKSIKYIQQKKNKKFNLTILLITNGSLITPKIAKFLKENNIEVGISLDGPKKINDKMRIIERNKGTYKFILNGLNLLKKFGVKFGISCTINPYNISILERISKWFAKDLKIASLGFNLPMNSLSYKNKINKKLIARKLISSYKILTSYNVFEDRMNRKINVLQKRELYFKDCGAYEGQLVISPEGDIGICHAFVGTKKYFFTNISKLKINKKTLKTLENNKYIKAWINRHPLNLSKCLKCPALGICGGGCAYNSYLMYGSILKLDEVFCEHAKETLKWFIWEKHKKSKI